MLHIQTSNVFLQQLIRNEIENRRMTDSGFDIPMLKQTLYATNNQVTLDFDIKIACTDKSGNPEPVLLIPRSSISSTSMRLSNSIGLIDMGYRGSVKAKVDLINKSNEINIEEKRYFQLCRQNWMPWETVKLVNDLPLPPDSRGEGGFGSTG